MAYDRKRAAKAGTVTGQTCTGEGSANLLLFDLTDDPMSPQISQSTAMRRDEICTAGPSNRIRLEVLVDRNTRCRWCGSPGSCWQRQTGHGTDALMRRTAKSKPCVGTL